VVCSWDLQIRHIGKGLHPGSILCKYDCRKGDFQLAAEPMFFLSHGVGSSGSALLMAGAGPDSSLFSLYESRHYRTVMECTVFMILAMEVGVIGR